MSVSDAWLLAITDDSYVAIGNLEMVHIHSDIPELIALSEEGSCCQQKVLWQEQNLSLLDIGLFLYGEPSSDKTVSNHETIFLCIITYMNELDEVQEYGALFSRQLPVRIKVDDKQACELPDSPEGWSILANSCFSHKNFGVVPILNLTRIFSTQADPIG